MRIFDARATYRERGATAAACILPDGANTPFDIWFRYDGCAHPLDGVGDALAVGLLLPAMFEAQPLIVEEPISRRLGANLAKAQEVLSCWYDYLSPVRVTASNLEDAQERGQRAAGVACCFTGGVDSWYSLLKHEDRITHLLLVRGFDIGLDNDVLWNETRAKIASVAARMGKKLITCETNLRVLADKRRAKWGKRHDGDFWGECLHGAALASVALALRQEIGELIVPATHTYHQVKPWGSSPLLDPHWSSHRIRITHDGCEAGRVDKTRALSRSDCALDTLRVCYDDTALYNCGRCEKCLRTMMALRICGALGRAQTFPGGLSLADVHRLIIPLHVRHRYDELTAAARQAGDEAVLRAVQAAIGQQFSLAHSAAVFKQTLRDGPMAGPLRSLLRVARGFRPAHQGAGP
jgi:hypothetical protein